VGCDIHIVLERREAGSAEWVGVWLSDALPGGRPMVARRDYDFFNEFGVRGQIEGRSPIYPRNVPKDVSRLAWLAYMSAPTDHHSVSYATTEEFTAAWLRANRNNDKVRPEFASYDLLNVDTDFDGDHRLVFWFDN
jgi:hypothetical protein